MIKLKAWLVEAWRMTICWYVVIIIKLTRKLRLTTLLQNVLTALISFSWMLCSNRPYPTRGKTQFMPLSNSCCAGCNRTPLAHNIVFPRRTQNLAPWQPPPLSWQLLAWASNGFSILIPRGTQWPHGDIFSCRAQNGICPWFAWYTIEFLDILAWFTSSLKSS